MNEIPQGGTSLEKEFFLTRVKFFLQKKRLITKVTILFALVGVTLLVAILISGILTKQALLPIEQYTLVPDKISQSAAIAVELPPDILFQNFNPSQSLSFSPEIKGKWEAANPSGDKIYRFLPEEKMVVGAYYLVSLHTPELTIEKMFSIDEDPLVLSVFPKSDTEVNEYSNITIMFNRPIVPLSTLSENSDILPPVDITPKTEGRFKWITTRTLQFIPAKRLLRSSSYSVQVNDGFRSLDGVKVKPFTHVFTTRSIKYVSGTNNAQVPYELTHDQPFRVVFNQPFDLEKTRQAIVVTSPNSVGATPFEAAYGTRDVYDAKTGKSRTLTDQSVLEIFPMSDAYGRPYLWNFDTRYIIAISGAIPLEGDVTLSSAQNSSVHITPIVHSVSAQSKRSNLVTPDFFDPEGTLEFHLSEPVDLAASKISGRGIQGIDYGEKCESPATGEEVNVDPNSCKKIPDQQILIVHFNAAEFGMNDSSIISLNTMVNTSGITLNPAPLTEEITTYPLFQIGSTIPEEGARAGSLKSLIICSTSPLARPLDDEFYGKVRSNMMIGSWNWRNSFRVTSSTYGYEQHCPINSFETRIEYGLVPKFNYEITLDLDDHFGQHLNKVIRFTSEDADPLDKAISHLQPSVVMTPPERTTLTYGLDFMNEMDVTVCKVTPETMLSLRSIPLSVTDGTGSIDCVSKKSNHLILPESYATRRYLQINLKDYYSNILGNYVVVLSNPNYRQVSWVWDSVSRQSVKRLGKEIFEKTYITVTRLAVASKQVMRYGDQNNTTVDSAEFMQDKWPTNLYWVNDFAMLAPVYGAVVTQYQYGGTKNTRIDKLPAVKTNIEGIAEPPSASSVVGAVVTYGTDSAVVSNQSDSMGYTQYSSVARKEYVYSDRPIYRPGDTVHVKGISRIGYDAVFEIPTGSTTITVRDSQWQISRTADVDFSKNGTYEISFMLDAKAPLGYYSITSETGGYGSFQVEEYVAPQFKVDVTPDKEEYLSGDTAKISIAADYYFGVPVQSADAEYRIVSQDYYFDRFVSPYFNFGAGWYGNDSWYGDLFVTSGKVNIGSNGKGVINLDVNIDKLFSGSYLEKSKVLTVYVTVKNENGQSVSKQCSFIVHRGEFYAGLAMDDYFAREGEKSLVRVKTVDVDGKVLKVSNLELLLERVEWKSYKRQEVDGNFYYRTVREKIKINTVGLSTDKNGDATHEFNAGISGEYEFTISGKDERGNTVLSRYNFYVSGKSAVTIRPTNNATLELVADKTSLQVGDTGSFVIKSPYTHAKALVTLARGSTYEYKVLSLDTQLSEYQFPITEQYIPSVVASVLLLSSLPEIKYGEVYYNVGTKEKELSISIVPGKIRYLPGEEVELSVNVKDSRGNPVKAELSLSVVDMSILALVGNPKKHPVTFFYDYAPLTINTSVNVKNVLAVAEIPIGTKGGSGGGGGDLEKKKRGVFRDTAYWNGVIETDALGKASVKFTLPDNLTQWQVESVGITSDTRVGAGYSDFVARKSIMAVPLKPRFILPGDSFAVGGTIFNETDTTQTLDVSMSAPTLSLTGSSATQVTIEPHASISISFPARAPESVINGKHEFTFSAKNTEFEDVVTSAFPIERNETYEFTATAGRISESTWKEHLYLPKNVIEDRGGLTISLGATMATMLDSAVRQMLIYPYECSEQVASKLRAIALVKQNTSLFGTSSPMLSEKVMLGSEEYTVDQIVEIGLARLYQNQVVDGMPYYANLAPSFVLSVQALETYIDLGKAGYTVDAGKLDEIARAVFNYINFPRTSTGPTTEEIIAGSYALSRIHGPKVYESAAMTQRLLDIASNKTLTHSGLSTPALAYLAILSAQKKFSTETTNRLFSEFENRSSIDARGTIVNGSAEIPTMFYGNAITNTALAVKAFSEAKHDTPLMEGYLRAIKLSKARDGGWSSTYNTITVIDAMTAYLGWSNEANAQMNISSSIDGKPYLSVEYSKQNVLNTYATSVPMSALNKGETQVIQFLKKDLGAHVDSYYFDMLLKYFLPTATIAPRDEGFSVQRDLYRLDDTEFLRPVTEATQGDVLRGRVLVSVPKQRFNVTIEDFIPAGVEIVNQRFQTEDQSLGNDNGQSNEYLGLEKVQSPGLRWGSYLAGFFSASGGPGPIKNTDGMVSDEMYGNRSTALRALYPSAIEQHDDRIFAYINELRQGEYVYEYFVRALIPGTYQYLPLVVSELYTPEIFGRTAGSEFTVLKK